MQVLIRIIRNKEDEKVVLECVEMTKDFEDIKDYAKMKNGEDIVVSRMYAKEIKKRIMEG